MHHQQAAFHFYGQEWTVGGCIVAMSLLLLHHSFEGLHHYFPSRPTTRIIIFSKRCIFRFKLGGHRQSIDFQDNDAIGFFLLLPTSVSAYNLNIWDLSPTVASSEPHVACGHDAEEDRESGLRRWCLKPRPRWKTKAQFLTQLGYVCVTHFTKGMICLRANKSTLFRVD